MLRWLSSGMRSRKAASLTWRVLRLVAEKGEGTGWGAIFGSDIAGAGGVTICGSGATGAGVVIGSGVLAISAGVGIGIGFGMNSDSGTPSSGILIGSNGAMGSGPGITISTFGSGKGPIASSSSPVSPSGIEDGAATGSEKTGSILVVLVMSSIAFCKSLSVD